MSTDQTLFCIELGHLSRASECSGQETMTSEQGKESGPDMGEGRTGGKKNALFQQAH